jgi:hypothetical protein
MPNCPTCGGHARSSDLAEVGDSLACRECRRPKEVKGGKKREKKMAEMTKIMIVSFNIYEVPTKDGAKDHQIEVEASVAGLSLQYVTTFDKVRKFFTEKREKGKPAVLKAVQ